LTCRFKAGSDCAPIEGGVSEPLVGVALLPSLDSSVDRSVLKLAFDRLRSSLKFKNDGGMAVKDSSRVRISLSENGRERK
jgi:hypothetical protein